MKKLIFSLTAMIFAAFVLIGCDKDEGTSPDINNGIPIEKDIVQLAQESGFNKLAEALIRADLVNALEADGSFTVFAPSDEAFDALLETIGQESLQDIPVEVLQQLLLYHVLPQSVLSTEIMAGDITTLQGSDITLSLTNGLMVNDISVQTPYDVEASNGVIHAIDQVLVPSVIAQFVNTVLEPAYFSNDFTSLVAAVKKAELVETLLNTPDLSIFAPPNSAFDAAGIVVADTDKEILASVLTYHVVGAKVMSTEIPRDAPTINGNILYFSQTENGVYINGNTMISAVDIVSGNGIVHIVDQV